jgi:hypothetical protein
MFDQSTNSHFFGVFHFNSHRSFARWREDQSFRGEPEKERLINKIWNFPCQGWLPLGDYLGDGRMTVGVHSGLSSNELMLFGKLCKDEQMSLRELRIYVEAVVKTSKGEKNYWHVFFNRGRKPEFLNSTDDPNRVTTNRNCSSATSYFNKTQEGQQYLSLLKERRDFGAGGRKRGRGGGGCGGGGQSSEKRRRKSSPESPAHENYSSSSGREGDSDGGSGNGSSSNSIVLLTDLNLRKTAKNHLLSASSS